MQRLLAPASVAIARLAVALQALPLALIELNPVIACANEAVAVDALAQEEFHP